MNPGAPRVPIARPTGFHKPVDVDGAASVERQEAWGPCGLWHCSEFPGLGSSYGGLLRVLSGQHPCAEASTPGPRPSWETNPLVQGSAGPGSPRALGAELWENSEILAIASGCLKVPRDP